MDILHVETSQIQGVSCLTLALRTLLTDYCGLDAVRSAAFRRESVRRKFSGKVLVELVLYGLHLIVLETVSGTNASALLYIQLIRRFVPYVTHIVDAEVILDAVFRYQYMALVGRFGDDGETYASFFHQLFECLLVLYLNQDTRILGKQDLHDIALGDLIQVDIQTTLYVSEAHL